MTDSIVSSRQGDYRKADLKVWEGGLKADGVDSESESTHMEHACWLTLIAGGGIPSTILKFGLPIAYHVGLVCPKKGESHMQLPVAYLDKRCSLKSSGEKR